MDMGLISGVAAAYVLYEGCTQTCELDQQTFILLCVIVLVAALGARYMIKHSDGATADKQKLVLDWTELHQQELLDDKQQPKQIEPLK